jgi:hypothetical protein
MLAHVRPSPLNPVMHAQVNDPLVSAQFASVGWQLSMESVHSSILLQVVKPSPLNPVSHTHDVELFAQGEQETPTGTLEFVCEKSGRQAQTKEPSEFVQKASA